MIGYFTLANDSLPLTTSEQGELGLYDTVVLKAYPAVKLGRLAVASDLQGQGIGEQVMDLVHGEILDSASLSAARLVMGAVAALDRSGSAASLEALGCAAAGESARGSRCSTGPSGF